MDFSGFPLIGPDEGIVNSPSGEGIEVALGPCIVVRNGAKNQGCPFALDFDPLGVKTEFLGNPHCLGATGEKNRRCHDGYTYILKSGFAIWNLKNLKKDRTILGPAGRIWCAGLSKARG